MSCRNELRCFAITSAHCSRLKKLIEIFIFFPGYILTTPTQGYEKLNEKAESEEKIWKK